MIDDLIHPGYLRSGAHESIAAGLAWGVPRCGNPPARALYIALVTLLHSFNATIVPVKAAAGEESEINFRVTLSRFDDEGRPVRQEFAIVSDRAVAERIDPEIRIFEVTADECATPWAQAARIVGAILTHVSNPDQ